MKKCMIILSAAFYGTVSVAAVGEGESRNLLDRETGVLSARLLAADCGRRWAAEPSPDAAEELAAQMGRDSGSVTLAGARQAAERNFRARIAREYTGQLTELLKPFSAGLPPEALAELVKAPPPLLEEKFKRHFPAAFAAARHRVVGEQRGTLLEKIYPTEAELAAHDDTGLTALLTGRFQSRRGAPLFEENLPYLRDGVIAPVLASARSQQKRQLEAVARLPVDSGVWEPAAVVSALERQLLEEIGTWKEDKVYGLFPATRAALVQRANRLPLERLAAELPRAFVLPDYGALLERSPAGHRDPAASLNALGTSLRHDALRRALEHLAPPPAVAAALAADPGASRAVEAEFDRSVRPALTAIRKRSAEQQLKRLFPALAARNWRPLPAEAEAFYAGGGKELPPVEGMVFADDSLLAETAAEAEARARAALTAAAAEVAGQFNLVAAEYDAVTAEMRKRNAGDAPGWLGRWFGLSGGVTLDAIRELYEEKVGKAWLAGGAKRGYPELFAPIKAEIDVRSRAILQQLREPDETPRPEPPPRNTEEPRVMRCRIGVDGDDKELRIRFNGRIFRAAPGEAAEQRLISEAAAEFARFGEAAAANGPVKLEIELRVDNGPVYYRFVANLREALKGVGQVNDELLK